MTSHSPARPTPDLPRWMRSALLLGALIDAREGDRKRRERVVDAAMYLVALNGRGIGVADTWTQQAAWVGLANVAVGLAALAALHWRRTQPETVGLWITAASVVIVAAIG